jgi:hypothetical protein
MLRVTAKTFGYFPVLEARGTFNDVAMSVVAMSVASVPEHDRAGRAPSET